MGRPLLDDSRVASSWITSQLFHQNPVLDAKNICRDPIHRLAETRKSPVHDHEVSFSHDRSRFVLQRWWEALDEIEETLTAWFNVSAVLDVVGRPEAFSCYIVTFVEKGVKSLKNKCLIFFLFSRVH